ncbi:MAG: hypothetical protein JW981_05385 [Anaerolineae bacterium]|nr:hypothetical protein [Anaerolineae bacterium]
MIKLQNPAPNSLETQQNSRFSRTGERGIVLIMGLLLLINAIAQRISGIVAISGFLDVSNTEQILLVWIVDMVVIIVITGLQSLIIDRFERVILIRRLLLGFMVIFIALRLFFPLFSNGLNYALLYLISEQQLFFFPLVFWIFCNDIFSMAESKRLFPLIASWGFVGKLIGIGLAAVTPYGLQKLNLDSQEVLLFNAGLYALAYLLAQWGLSKIELHRPQPQLESLRETLTEGWGFVREVLSFRYLMLAILLLLVCDTILEFRFLEVSERAYPNAGNYQTFYSLYYLGFTLVSFAIQGLISGDIIASIGLKNTFFILPFSALAGGVWMLVQPGLVSGVGGVLLQKIPEFTIDESARKTLQSLVPEERRGRVSIFMDSYLLAVGTILGSVITGLVLIVTRWPGSGLQTEPFYIYLPIAILCALLAVGFIFKMRTHYDSSLLNWRLKRRQRGKSILDKLDF